MTGPLKATKILFQCEYICTCVVHESRQCLLWALNDVRITPSLALVESNKFSFIMMLFEWHTRAGSEEEISSAFKWLFSSFCFDYECRVTYWLRGRLILMQKAFRFSGSESHYPSLTVISWRHIHVTFIFLWEINCVLRAFPSSSHSLYEILI